MSADPHSKRKKQFRQRLNAVQPGKSFNYTFKADVPGTYWYHPHQDSENQVDRGLYGAFIVESSDDNVDRDYSLVLDEWASLGSAKMDMGHDINMYDLYTVNGKSGSLVDKLSVMQGDKVRIRLINAGFVSHQIHLHSHEFKITTTDRQPVNQPRLLKDNLISIAPGERYDIEFEANNPFV